MVAISVSNSAVMIQEKDVPGPQPTALNLHHPTQFLSVILRPMRLPLPLQFQR